MKWLTNFAVSLLAVTVVGVLGYVGLIIYINLDKSQIIANNVAVGAEWLELDIEPPTSAKAREQSILLDIDGIQDPWGSGASDLLLKDGTVLLPEIELLDNDGNLIPFKRSGLSRKDKVFVVFRPKKELSPESRFVKVRIRSDVAFQSRSIRWRDYNPK